MRTRKLGTSELELSVIGLGTWAIGGGDWSFAWGPQDEADSIAAIHSALDCGINWIDTAPVYGLGTAEEVVGKALRGRSERPLIATKCGRTWTAEGSIVPRITAESIRSEAEDSLRRLQVEVIDLYQIHWPEPEEDLEEAWEAVADLRRQGKIRYGGVSNFDATQLAQVHALHPVTSLQPPYSMLKRQVEEHTLPWCAAHGTGVIAYSPMQKGLLTGRMTPERMRSLPEDDHRRRDPMFQGAALEAAAELVESLGTLAAEAGRRLPELSVAWVLRRPEVTAAIVGARRPDQIRETAAAATWELDEATLRQVDAALSTYANRTAGS